MSEGVRMSSFLKRREALIRAQDRPGELDGISRDAKRAAGYREGCRFPEGVLELANRITDHDRNRFFGPVTNAQRNKLAAGMPYADITPEDGISRAQPDLDAVDRYRQRWADIELQEAA